MIPPILVWHNLGYGGNNNPRKVVCDILVKAPGASLLPPVERGMNLDGVTPLDVLAGDHNDVFFSLAFPGEPNPSADKLPAVALGFDAEDLIARGARVRTSDFLRDYGVIVRKRLRLDWLKANEAELICAGPRTLAGCQFTVDGKSYDAKKLRGLLRDLHAFKKRHELTYAEALEEVSVSENFPGNTEVVFGGPVPIAWAKSVLVCTAASLRDTIANVNGWKEYTITKEAAKEIKKRVCGGHR